MTGINTEHKVKEISLLLEDVQRNYMPTVFANSFGAEDMVLTDIIAHYFPDIRADSLRKLIR
jgi:phosphoadenosine phosphosulfate reductase